MRRIVASNIVIINKEFHKNHVVELFNHKVCSHYPLTEEQANTEWLGGSIMIIGDEAYHTKAILTTAEFCTYDCRCNSNIKRL